MSSSRVRDSSICEPRYVLVACEESQAVTIAFRRLGVLAFSCDIKPCSGGHPEWHIVQPFYFGDPFYKTTCLWLVGLPILMSWGACVPEYHWVSGSYAPGDTKVGQSTPAGRSKTSPALAAAMAQQWVKYL